MKLILASKVLSFLVAASPLSCCAFQPSGSNPKTITSSIPSSRAFFTKSSSRTHLYSTVEDATTKRAISLYNSLTRTKEPFVPILSDKVSMYTCGPTVYDYAHVGNFRAFLTYDVLKRALTYFGHNVDHICNLTDVDDKIIARCTREDMSLLDLTRKFEGKFMDDLMALNIVPAREYPRATEHIDEMVGLIQELEAKGLAYQSEEGSWYFNVAAKEGYGQQLVNLDVGNMKKGASGEAGAQRTTEDSEADADADEYDVDKVGARDFALWKAYKPKFDREDATWDTEIGNGRPGWHLECSAMARKYLGDSIDIHCGGIDLQFPHHENEIAQSEGATGEKFCNCWLHNGFVNIGDEKMSKSKGNFLTLRTACSTSDDVRAYRYLVVSSQYRNPLSFTEAALGAAKGALKRMDSVMKQLDEALKDVDINAFKGEESAISVTVDKELSNFETALADDLSMPRGAASLFGVVKSAETEFKRYKKEQKDADSDDGVKVTLDLNGLVAVREAILQMDKVFGIFYEVPKEKNDDGSEITEEITNDAIPEEVMELVQSRTAAKDAKDWDAADSFRSQITELGFAVKDMKGGDPIVTRI